MLIQPSVHTTNMEAFRDLSSTLCLSLCLSPEWTRGSSTTYVYLGDRGLHILTTEWLLWRRTDGVLLKSLNMGEGGRNRRVTRGVQYPCGGCASYWLDRNQPESIKWMMVMLRGRTKGAMKVERWRWIPFDNERLTITIGITFRFPSSKLHF